MSALFNALIKAIASENNFSSSLAQYKEKIETIRHQKMHYLLKERAYLNALGLDSNKEINDSEVFLFVVKNDHELALKYVQELQIDFAKWPDEISEILNVVIESGDIVLFKKLLQLEAFDNKVNPSMYGLAMKQNNLEFLELIRKSLNLELYFKPEVVTRILEDPNSNIKLSTVGPFKFIRSFPASDLKSDVILPLIEWIELTDEFDKSDDSSPKSHHDFDLARKEVEKKFNGDFLRKVSNDFGLLTLIPLSTIFDKVHPDGQITSPLTALDARYLTTRYGHLLGLSQKLNLQFGDQEYQLPFESNEPRISLQYLLDALDGYIQNPTLQNKPEKDYFVQIRETFSYAREEAQKIQTDENAAKRIYDRYQSGKMTTIPAGWQTFPGQGHGVNVTFYGSYMIYTNRGEGGFPGAGSQIFKIKNASKITPELIRKLHLFYKNKEEFHSALMEIVDLGHPLISFPSKYQEHGNCSLANPKSAIEPMLLLFAHSTENGPNIEGHEYIQVNRNQYLYKDFTRFLRDQTIEDVIAKSKLAQTPLMQAFYVNLVKNIVLQHHGVGSRSEEKAKEEVVRLNELLNSMPSSIQEALVKDEAVRSCLEKIGLEPASTSENKGRVKMIFSKILQHPKSEKDSLLSSEKKPEQLVSLEKESARLKK